MARISNAAVHSIHSMTSSDDQRFMRAAIKHALRGAGGPSSKPLVGAVVVARGRVAGSGFAKETGVTAVAAALKQAGSLARGATVYTTLDPCADNPENGIVEGLIEHRVGRIVVGSTGNAISAASGLERLRTEGIEIETGVLEADCREVNEKYLKYASTGSPFLTLKFAQSLDGRIATATGDSQWISSSGARRFAHQLRREHDAIVVGIGTVLADDPRLSVRLVSGKDPLRIVIDSRLRTPLTAKVLADGAAGHTILATSESADRARQRDIEALGAEVLRIPSMRDGQHIDLNVLFQELGRRKIASGLVEGGKAIITSLLRARAVDRLIVVVAPKLIGAGTEAVGDLDIRALKDAITFSSIRTRKLGPDIVFDARLK